MLKTKSFLEPFAIWILVAIFAAIYSFWSVTRHNRFQTDAVDLGIFDQPLWRYSRFETPLSTIKFNTFPGENILGDHFHPLIIPLAFLYRLWDDVRILLMAQVVLAVSSVYPIYLLAKKKVSLIFALSLSFAYLSFIGFQTAIDFDFHEVTAGVAIVSWAVYFLLENNFKLFYLFMFLGFLLKEDVPLLFSGLGLFAIFQLKKYRQGFFIFLICLLYYFLLVKFIIPFFKHDRFAYEELDRRIGQTSFDLFYKVLTNPALVVEVFFLPPVKFKTMLNLIGSFALLPFLAPLTFLPVIPNFIGRFLTGLPQRWLIRYQYNIILTPLFALGAILGILFLSRLGKRFGKERIVSFFSVLLLIVPVVQTIRTNSPLKRILDPKSYVPEERFKINYRLLSMIPQDPQVSVMAQSTLVPHLTHRFEIYRFEDWVLEARKPDYVMMSADEGSDPPWGREVKLEKIANLAKNPHYQVLYYDGVRLLLRRKGVEK